MTDPVRIQVPIPDASKPIQLLFAVNWLVETFEAQGVTNEETKAVMQFIGSLPPRDPT